MRVFGKRLVGKSRRKIEGSETGYLPQFAGTRKFPDRRSRRGVAPQKISCCALTSAAPSHSQKSFRVVKALPFATAQQKRNTNAALSSYSARWRTKTVDGG